MGAQPKADYTLEEYFELEKTSEARYEYWDGEVFDMSGVSPRHSLLESNLNLNLRLALRGRNCLVFPANARIKVPSVPPYRYADLSVVCGNPVYETTGGIEALTNPILIIEVLSPSTEAYDRGDKFTYYKSIPSLKEYLLIAQHRPHVTQYVKQDDSSWSYSEVNDLTAVLQLPSIGCELALADVYQDVEFPPQPHLSLAPER